MIEFRDETAKRLGIDLLIHVNQNGMPQVSIRLITAPTPIPTS